MLTREKIEDILSEISYKNWQFRVDNSGPALFLQVRFKSQDNDNPEITRWQHGRKWYLSRHMTKSELVQTALKAVLTAEEHEVRELFTYRGEAIFGPHFHVDDLVRMARETEPDLRAPMISRSALDRMQNEVIIVGGRNYGKTLLAEALKDQIKNHRPIVVPGDDLTDALVQSTKPELHSDNGKPYQKKPRITNNLPENEKHK